MEILRQVWEEVAEGERVNFQNEDEEEKEVVQKDQQWAWEEGEEGFSY